MGDTRTLVQILRSGERIAEKTTEPPAEIRNRILGDREKFLAFAILPRPNFFPRLVIFDTDSTFINQEVIDEIADFAGVKPAVARITELAMQGELDFDGALKERVALLKGLPDTTLNQVLALLTVTRGAEQLIRDLKERGVLTYLVSGGFSFFTSALRKRYGLTGDYANELEIHEGRLTGRTRGPVVNRARKAALLSEIAARSGISLSDTVSVGDGANDIDMAKTSGLGIAFCARPALLEVADAAIFERDLNLVSRLIFPA